MSITHSQKIAGVGGGGHVGLPLGLALCDAGHRVTLVDTSQSRLDSISAGHMPFQERGGEEMLEKCLASDRLLLTTDYSVLGEQEIVIVTIGTPVDEYLDPAVREFDQVMSEILDSLRDGQLLIMRSTVFPGVTDRLHRQVTERNLKLDVCYCPERIAQGYALEEFSKLPQLVAGCTEQAAQRAKTFFAELDCEPVLLSPIEAELGKLFTNSYRYINFAISNQFYMLAEHFGADFQNIHAAITKDYPRLKGFATAGFAGGPCLLKDTMQLASFNHNLLTLGQHAMMVNEGLPQFLVEQIKQTRNLHTETVGILGMTFKGNCDDPRSSLSFKLRKVLTLECRRVLCTDPYLSGDEMTPLETVLEQADVLILGACHDLYREQTYRQPVIDVFGFLPKANV